MYIHNTYVYIICIVYKYILSIITLEVIKIYI